MLAQVWDTVSLPNQEVLHIWTGQGEGRLGGESCPQG